MTDQNCARFWTLGLSTPSGSIRRPDERVRGYQPVMVGLDQLAGKSSLDVGVKVRHRGLEVR